MGAVLERGYDAEVAAAAAQGPEQLGVGIVAGRDDLTGGQDHLGRQQVVDGQPIAAHQPALTATQGQARDPRARDRAAGRCEPKRRGCSIELADEYAWLRSDRLPDWIDVDALHRRQVDHQSFVGDGLSGDVVAASAYGDLQSLLAAEVDRVDHVCGAKAAGDQGGSLVDEAVVDAPRLVVVGGAGTEDLAGELRRERLDG
jgi:hypothetical protein